MTSEDGKAGKGLSRRIKYVIGGVLLVVIVGATAGIVIWQTLDPENAEEKISYTLCDPTDSPMEKYQNAAVAADAPQCAEIGKNMLRKGGSVADAGIAAVLCMGIMHPMSSGVGGGFLMVMYDASTGQSSVMNAREVAPGAADENMFQSNTSWAARGPLAVAVPGELKGLWELHKKSGRLLWKELLQPAIELCRDGIPVSRSLAAALNSHRNTINNTPSVKEILWNVDKDDVYKEGEIMRRTKLAETLETIANSSIGADELYTGAIMKNFVADLKAQRGIIEEADMENYTVDEPLPIKISIGGGFTLHTVPPPGSGILVAYMLKLLENLPVPDTNDLARSIMIYHRIAEAFKHAYAQRTKLGDPFDIEIKEIVEEVVRNLTDPAYIADIRGKISDDLTHNDYEYYGAEFYSPEDHGTAHVSIIGENGDAIGITTTVNLYFGALIGSTSTGIIYNDQMDDFSAPNITNSFGVPPSPNNFIVPGKRPMSSMSPSIFTDEEGRVRLVVGGAGGTTITTAITQVAINNLRFGYTVKESIDSFRIHHQLYPMLMEYEQCLPQGIAKGLQRLGHVMEESGSLAVTSSVGRTIDGTIYANADYRKANSIAGY